MGLRTTPLPHPPSPPHPTTPNDLLPTHLRLPGSRGSRRPRSLGPTVRGARVSSSAHFRGVRPSRLTRHPLLPFDIGPGFSGGRGRNGFMEGNARRPSMGKGGSKPPITRGGRADSCPCIDGSCIDGTRVGRRGRTPLGGRLTRGGGQCEGRLANAANRRGRCPLLPLPLVSLLGLVVPCRFGDLGFVLIRAFLEDLRAACPF